MLGYCPMTSKSTNNWYYGLYTCIHMHNIRTCMHARTHTYERTYARARTHTHTHTHTQHTHTHTHTRMHTHTHTHTQYHVCMNTFLLFPYHFYRIMQHKIIVVIGIVVAMVVVALIIFAIVKIKQSSYENNQ